MLRTSDLESPKHRIAVQVLFKSYDFFGDKVTNELIDSNRLSESDNLMRIIGVIGNKVCVKYLIDEVTKYSKSTKATDSFYYIASINSLGLVYNKDSVELLEKILYQRHNSEHESTDIYFSLNWNIARSLYLLTGERYIYDGISGKNVKVPITRGLQTIRNAIKQSDGTARSYNQMIVLYDLALPITRDNSFYSIVEK